MNPTCKRNRLKGEPAVVVVAIEHTSTTQKRKNSHTCMVKGRPSSWRKNAQGNVVHVDCRGMSHLHFYDSQIKVTHTITAQPIKTRL